MKKWFILLGALSLCACAGINKNTVSYQMSKYDQHIYYVIAAEGTDKTAAAANALAAMRRNIEQNVPNVDIAAQQVEDILANAKIGKVWRDKSSKNTKHYFALALLKRQTAETILQAPINQTDDQLGALSAQLQATENKFAGLRAAFAMEPLIAKRNVLQDLYIFLSAGHTGYETERFNAYKKLYNDRLAAVKVATVVKGEENVILLSHVTDALHQMGLGTVEAEDTAALLAVEVQAQVDGYQSERLKGLEWVAASAVVSLRDLQEKATFAQFNVNDRAGTSRRADSLRKSMEGIGEKAAAEITVRMMDYLKTK